jgi:hypothetical protein
LAVGDAKKPHIAQRIAQLSTELGFSLPLTERDLALAILGCVLTVLLVALTDEEKRSWFKT